MFDVVFEYTLKSIGRSMVFAWKEEDIIEYPKVGRTFFWGNFTFIAREVVKKDVNGFKRDCVILEVPGNLPCPNDNDFRSLGWHIEEHIVSSVL